jgi:hypothetical protein
MERAANQPPRIDRTDTGPDACQEIVPERNDRIGQ